MRILILSTLYFPNQVGGAEKAAKLLAEGLTERGDDVCVVSLHPGQQETTENLNGVRVYRVPLDNIYWPFGENAGSRARLSRLVWHIRDIWNWRAAARFGAILDKELPDVVHSHSITGFSVSVWGQARKRRIRVVHTMHDYYLLCGRSTCFRNGVSCTSQCVACRVLTAPSRWSIRRLNVAVSVSQFVSGLHRRWGYASGQHNRVIYNIQTSLGTNSWEDRLAKTRSCAFIRFGYIGGINEKKGLRNVLKALRLLGIREWCLSIAGAGPRAYVEELQAEFRDPRIEWLGYTESKRFYEAIDVLLVPSIWHDPLPYVVVEALAAGKSLICSDSGGLLELARLGRMVATYPATDLNRLAELLSDAVSHPCKWRDGGFKDVDSANAFSEDRVVLKYRETYQNGGQGIADVRYEG